MISIIDGVEQIIPKELVSLEIFNAIQENNKWPSERYCLVEIGDLFPAWITSQEQIENKELKTLDEIDAFVERICIMVVNTEDFERWRQSEI